MAVGRVIEISRGDLLMEGAKSLQLQLRKRFRVAAIDYRRRQDSRIKHDGDFSSTVQHFVDRFSNFRRDSLPSSSVFYRKTVSKDIDEENDSFVTRMLQSIAVPVLGNVCHVFMHGLNRVQIFGAENLHEVLLRRPENKSLITVSNHVAGMDDPLVIASLLPPSLMLNAQNMRWTLCASDRCFKNRVTSAFFKYVKVLPVARGDGIYQKGMDLAISKLNRGGWVHIFPEGSRSRDGGKTMGSAKRGIGRLVLDSDKVPIVVPFVHTGMQDVLPVGSSLPRIGKTVTVLIGDAIHFDDITEKQSNTSISRGQLYDAVSARIGDRLLKLKFQVEELANTQTNRLQNYHSQVNEQAGQKDKPENDINRSEEWRSRVELSGQDGLVSRLRGYMDGAEFVGFAARGLFNRNKEYFGSLQRDSPLREWKKFWKSTSGYNFPPTFSFN